MAKRIGLGRGLDALLDNNDGSTLSTPEQMFKQSIEETIVENNSGKKSADGEIVQFKIDNLHANPNQPRKHFDEAELQELAASIKTYGIIYPIIAADTQDGTCMIIAGERRFRAAKIAGLDTVPVIIVKNYSDQKQLEISLTENVQRTGLNPIEEAAAYKNLMDFAGISQEELASRVGKNRTTVTNSLRLLKLSVEMQRSVEDGSISSGHARALLSVTDTKAREKLYKEILDNGLNVREAEKRAGELTADKDGKSDSKKGKAGKSGRQAGGAKGRPPEVDAMVEKFITRLGTKVVIDGDLNKGRILIDYYSMEDLERLYEILG